MNMQYHAAREAWLDSTHRWLMFGVILLGASAIVEIDPARPWLRPLTAAVAAVLGALDLAFDLSNRARNHALMRRCYGDVLAEAERNPDALGSADSALSKLAGEEEPAFEALLNACYNAAERQVYGDDRQAVVVPLPYSILRNVVRFSGHVFADKHPQT